MKNFDKEFKQFLLKESDEDDFDYQGFGGSEFWKYEDNEKGFVIIDIQADQGELEIVNTLVSALGLWMDDEYDENFTIIAKDANGAIAAKEVIDRVKGNDF